MVNGFIQESDLFPPALPFSHGFLERNGIRFILNNVVI